MSTAPAVARGARAARVLPFPAGAGLARHVVGRNVVAFRRAWILLISGFAEPVFYLFSLGIGIGALVGTVTTDGGTSAPLTFTYEAAPAGAPVLASLTPETGPAGGGTSVTITGSGFLPGSTVTVGGTDGIVPDAIGGGATLLVPFTRDAVPEVDVEGGRLTVVLPEELSE